MGEEIISRSFSAGWNREEDKRQKIRQEREMDSINQIWPKWHTQELLGKGAFGEVYKVKREELGETFYSAVKVIRIPHDTDEIKELLDEGHTSQSIRYYYESIAKGLMNEIKVLEILKSAGNVVNIEEFEVHERTESVGWDAYIRMELLKNLNEYRRGHKMDVKETVKLGMDICHALICCEQSRIIHRDIKPSNIFVDAYGNFKLGDFGIARQMEKTRSTLSQKGTEMYMAPEVRFGDGQSSYNVDIYSLGLVMYRLLNKNRMPFEPLDAELISYQDKEAALTRRLRGEELPLPAEAPEALGRIILKACEADKDKRYQSASQMQENLDRWIRGGTVGQKRDHSRSFQSQSADKAPENLLKADSAKKEEKEVFGKKTRASSEGRPADERTVLGFDTGADQAETGKRKKSGSSGQQKETSRSQQKETLEPVHGEDVTIRQYIDEKTAEKGGKIIITAGNGKQIEVAVPPKWKDGMKLRLRECGKPGKNGGEPGDTYLELLILKPKKESGKKKNRDTKENNEKKSPSGSRGTLWILIGIIVVQNLVTAAVFPVLPLLAVTVIVMVLGLYFCLKKQKNAGGYLYLAGFFFNGAIMSVGTTIIVGFIHMGLMFPVAKLLGKARKS